MNQETTNDELRNYLEIALALLMNGTFAVLKIPDIIKIFEGKTEATIVIPPDFLGGILSSLLFMTTCLFISLWVFFDIQEIRLKNEVFESGKIQTKSYLFFLAIGLGLLAGVLITFVDNPRMYSIIAGIMILLSLLALIFDVNKQLKNQLAKEGMVEIADAIKNYYFGHSFILLDSIGLILLIFGFIIQWITPNWLGLDTIHWSYIFVIISLWFHEGIIWSWRISRNRIIENIRLDE